MKLCDLFLAFPIPDLIQPGLGDLIQKNLDFLDGKEGERGGWGGETKEYDEKFPAPWGSKRAISYQTLKGEPIKTLRLLRFLIQFTSFSSNTLLLHSSVHKPLGTRAPSHVLILSTTSLSAKITISTTGSTPSPVLLTPPTALHKVPATRFFSRIRS